jgi:hypothetical protein
LATLAIVATATGGCVGVTDRDDFDAMVDARGGGLSGDLVPDALDAIAGRAGTDPADLELLQISISPGDRTVVATVRDPHVRDNVDTYVYRARGGLDDPEPVQVSIDDDLDARAFRVADTPALSRSEEMADAAFAELGFDGPHVESVTGSRSTGEVRFQMTIESDRARGQATFAADGTLVEAVRQ